MKATSQIFQSLQAPVTIFGLPPKLLVFVLGASAPVIPICSFLGLASLALIAPLIVFVIGGILVWRLRRQDPHCETVIFFPRRFFKGKNTRTLISGSKEISLADKR